MIVFGTIARVGGKGPDAQTVQIAGLIDLRCAAARAASAVVFFVWRNLDKKLMATVGETIRFLASCPPVSDRLAALRAGEGIGQFFRWKFDFVAQIQTYQNRVSPAIC